MGQSHGYEEILPREFTHLYRHRPVGTIPAGLRGAMSTLPVAKPAQPYQDEVNPARLLEAFASAVRDDCAVYARP